MRTAVFSFLAAFFGLGGAASASETPTFDREVAQLLKARCAQCHGVDPPKAGLDMRTRAGLLAGGKTGPAVTPGSLRDSLLWTNIANDKMPAKGEKLTADEKDLLRRWILAGAPATAADVASSQSAPPPDAQSTPRGVEATARAIDAEIDVRLKAAGLTPSPPAGDAEFLRRTYLDLTGCIPTLEQTTEFLASTSPDKRRKLIDDLLASPRFGHHLAMTWHKLLLPKTAESYSRIDHDQVRAWLAEQFNAGRGWDQIVTELLTAKGYAPTPPKNGKPANDKRDPALVSPPAAYILIHHEEGRPQPRLIAASSSRLFLGVQLECAQCHHHPQAKWKQEEFWGVAAFFERVRYPSASENGGQIMEPATGKDLLYNQKGRYWFVPAVRGEPLIDVQDEGGRETGKLVRAKFLGGDSPEMDPQASYREVFARWATAADNPYFARAMANRVWAHLFGRGLVEPVDDLQEDNPPAHPLVLSALAGEFAAAGFDLKHLFRTVCTTRAYQRASRPAAKPSVEPDDNKLLAHQNLKLLSAEALLDSLCTASHTMAAQRAVKPDERGRTSFSEAEFLSVLESDESAPTEHSRGIIQALRLMNRDGKLFDRAALAKIVRDADSPETNIERIYLTVLSRPPTEKEQQRMLAFVRDPLAILASNPVTPAAKPAPTRGSAAAPQGDPYVDLYWALLNSGEFIFNH